MAVFPRPSSPRAVWADLKTFLAGRERHRLLFAFLAIAITGLMLLGFYVDSRPEPQPPQIIYAQSWPASRTDAEIIAQQKIDQKKLDARREEKRRQYQRLAKQLGID